MNPNAKTISLSKFLGVTRQKLEELDVFDATLGVDTKLFVDPKLLAKTSVPELNRSKEALLSYFDKLLRIQKQSVISPRLKEIAINMLAIPEPLGLSIGYGNSSDGGTSVPKNVALEVLRSAAELILVGIEDKEVFELLGLFVKGFGSDSISDLSIHIVYKDLCKYTERVCKILGVKTQRFPVDGRFYNLPKHPFRKKQLIFSPHSILRPLPLANSWEDIADASMRNKKTRETFNKIIKPVFLKEIKKTETANSNIDPSKNISAFKSLIEIYKTVDVEPYDLVTDKKGYYDLQPFVDKSYSSQKNVVKPSNFNTLVDSVREIIMQYKKAIELNGANKLLYHKSNTGVPIAYRPHREDVPQILFYIISDVECQNRNIILSREPNAGLGPVDFSLAKTHMVNMEKVLVEIKKSDNTSLFDGFTKQITKYEESENAQHGCYVVIRVKKENPRRQTQLRRVENEYEKRKLQKKLTPELFIIDGLIYPSPSKL